MTRIQYMLISHASNNANGLWRMLVFCCMLAMTLGCDLAAAQASRVDVEQQVKAAYLYKFGSYVEWPESSFAGPGDAIRIGIVGANPLADELAQMVTGRTVNGRPIMVKKVRAGDSVSGFNMLFIGTASNDRLAEILAATKNSPVLTVTESGDGLALGGVINFVVVEGKLRFEVAPKTAYQGSMNISARLLAAAFKVGM